MENVLTGYADPDVGRRRRRLRRSTSTSGSSGDNTIYVVATAHEQARLRPVLTVLVQQAIRAAYDTAAATTGGRLPHPCLVLLDEAGNTAPLPDLPGYASTARSHGITLVTVWQDLAQLRAIYRDRAQTVLNNHRAKLFGTGIADDATLDYVSRLIGDERRTERNLSGDLDGGRRTSASTPPTGAPRPSTSCAASAPTRRSSSTAPSCPPTSGSAPYYRDRELRDRARLPQHHRRLFRHDRRKR